MSTLSVLPKPSARNGLRIKNPDQIPSTIQEALEMQGPVLVAVPVDYRDNQRLMEIVQPEAFN
jgi:acetolactate synthase-1/2/3 large subunit